MVFFVMPRRPPGSTLTATLVPYTTLFRLHFGTTIEGDRRRTFFGEASFAGKTGRTSWLAGAAFQADIFRSVQFSGFNYSYTVPALFAQVEQDALNDLTRSEERSVGKEGVSTCKSRWSPNH